MDNESSYNSSFLFSSLVDDHDPDSQDITFNKLEANSNSNSFKNTTTNQESRSRKRPRNSDGHSDGFNPDNFFVKESQYNKDEDFYVSPAALNAITTLEDVLLTKTNIFNQPLDLTEINEECEIFTNDRGTVKLCIDGCLYIKNMKSGSTCYWQCVQKNLKNCHGCAVTYAVGEKHYLKRIRREHTHEATVHNTRGFSKVYEMQMKNLKENLSDCRFTKNRWGNPKLVIDGYFYVRHSTKGQIFYWKCEQRGQCDAYIVTQKNLDGTHKMGHILREHTHQPKLENEMKELRLSYIPKFSQSHLEQIKNAAVSRDKRPHIPNRKPKANESNSQRTAKTSSKSSSGGKRIEEGDSSSSMSLFSPNIPKLLTLKSSYDQEDEQFESDNSQTKSQFIKKTDKEFSRQSSQTSISQGSVKSSTATNSNSTTKSNKATKQKLQFKQIELGEKCEFVFLIDGVFKMLLNGFAYEIAEGKEGKSNALWRCSGHSKILVECSATADTVIFEGDHYLKGIKGKHNHPRCDEDVEDDEEDDDADVAYDDLEDNVEDQEEHSMDPESAERTSNDKHKTMTDRDDYQNDSNNSFDDSNNLMYEGTDEDSGKCEFIVTQRGLPKLTRGGYYYVRNSVNKNRAEITYWKCELKGRCTGTLVTVTQSDGYYVKSSKEHNHPPDPNKYLEPRFYKPEEVNLRFNEADPQGNENSSEEILIIPDEESKVLNNNPKHIVKSEDPLGEESSQNALVSVKTTAKWPTIKLDLIKTARGMPKIARNGYYYCKSSVNKNRQEITYWKCELKGQCKGFLISITKNDGYYFKSERTHSHPPDQDKYRAVRKSSFEELNNSFGTTFGQNSNTCRKRTSFNENLNLNRRPFVNTHLDHLRYNSTGAQSSFNKDNHFDSMRNYNEDNYSARNDNRNRLRISNQQPMYSENTKAYRNDPEPLPMVPEGGDPSVTYECEFIISCQGNPKLCLNGYMYTKNRDKNTNFYWNCEIKKSRHCMGYCVTEVRNGKHIVKKIRAHNHKADLRREMLSKKLSNILQKVYAKPLFNPRKIIDVELARLPEDVRRQLPKAYSIQRMVKRKVQEKVSTLRQSLVNGGYAPIPNMEPSTSKQQPQQQQQQQNQQNQQQQQQRRQPQPQPQHQNRNMSLHQSRNQYSGNVQSQHLYNDEYNFHNLYNSNNRSNYQNNPYQPQIDHNDFHEGFDQSSDYDSHNQINMNYNDPHNFQGSNSYNPYQSQYNNDDVYNCEIKNEPIDDYGYQNYEGEIHEQMDLPYDNSTGYNEVTDRESWNNGSAFANSYSNDGAYDNCENFDNDHNPTTNSNNSNEETSNSSENTENSHNSEEYETKIKEQQKQLQTPNQQNEVKNLPDSTNNVVYKKNQIAKKRIRAPEILNN